VPSLKSLSNASVKWLSQSTSTGVGGLAVLPGSTAVVSRMLGGLQLSKPFSGQKAMTGNTPMQVEGCLSAPPSCSMTPAQALVNVLTVYFAGTLVGVEYGALPASNNGTPVTVAPINYLQIWDTDILYAAGLGLCTAVLTKPCCTKEQLMSQPPPKKLSSLKCYSAPTDMAPFPFTGTLMTAQQLLDRASQDISSIAQAPVTLPPCRCSQGYVWREAFQGDYVCVTPDERSRVARQNATAHSNYSFDYTIPVSFRLRGVTRPVLYGLCTTNLQYRQADMGDYVCVSSNQAKRVKDDNAMLGSSRYAKACK
jgi:hypothetical protein